MTNSKFFEPMRCAMSTEGLVQRAPETSLGQHALELLACRRLVFVDDALERLPEAVAGLQPRRHGGEHVGQLVFERLHTLASLDRDDEIGHEGADREPADEERRGAGHQRRPGLPRRGRRRGAGRRTRPYAAGRRLARAGLEPFPRLQMAERALGAWNRAETRASRRVALLDRLPALRHMGSQAALEPGAARRLERHGDGEQDDQTDDESKGSSTLGGVEELVRERAVGRLRARFTASPGARRVSAPPCLLEAAPTPRSARPEAPQ